MGTRNGLHTGRASNVQQTFWSQANLCSAAHLAGKLTDCVLVGLPAQLAD